jgi:hypothetical protein
VADLWKQAGPFAGTRAESTDRSAVLAMIQPITPDTLVELGVAFRSLDAGDTLGAARTMEQAGKDLPADGGRSEVTLYAGRLYAAVGQAAKAEVGFRAAVLKEAPNTSAAALLELGRLLVTQNRRPEATQVLEQMILDYPMSALVPQARRLLDQARGGVPRT